uniref:PHD-type domain-containing protein n=1 Tax=Anopheles coluzzii TaxID=1518534 RepID=A0A8W7P1A0_ANOCL
MVSDSQKRKAIREFLIPDTLKDDIAYCQRSLRDCVKVHQPSPAARSPPSCTMSTPPPPVMPGPARTGNRRKTPPEQPLVPTKMLRSRSTTPVVVTVLKQEPKQELVEPEPPTAAAVNDTEDRATPPIVIRESAAVKRGRSNLLQALSKVKTTQKPATKPLPPTAPTATTTTSPPGSATKSARNCRAGSVSASSDSSNSRASTPGTSGGAAVQPKHTDEPVSAERLPPLSLPPLPPEEPTGTLPTSIDELEQYSFLKMFALHTIEDSNLLKGRKNERKRRSCCSTERKEYHYGRFDYYEQQFYIVQKRRYNANKRLLYTATSAEKAISARKPWTGGGVTIPPSPPPTSSASSQPVQDTPVVEVKPAQLESVSEEELQPENKLCCVVCNQIAGTSNEELRACADCSNNYHLSCHRQVDDVDGETEQKTVPKPAQPAEDGNGGEEANDGHQPPEQSNRCPACLALASIQQ